MLQSAGSVWHAVALTAAIAILLGTSGASAQPSSPSPPPAAAESNPLPPPAGTEAGPVPPPGVTESGAVPPPAPVESGPDECARREAIETSITRVESARSAGRPLEDLAAEITAIEKGLIELPPADATACRPALSITGLTERFDPIRQDLLNERRRRAVNAHPWPERVKAAVLENRVEIGMTREQVTAAWGQPRNVDVTAVTRQEQWTYGGPVYLYFTNGALVTIARVRRPLE